MARTVLVIRRSQATTVQDITLNEGALNGTLIEQRAFGLGTIHNKSIYLDTILDTMVENGTSIIEKIVWKSCSNTDCDIYAQSDIIGYSETNKVSIGREFVYRETNPISLDFVLNGGNNCVISPIDFVFTVHFKDPQIQPKDYVITHTKRTKPIFNNFNIDIYFADRYSKQRVEGNVLKGSDNMMNHIIKIDSTNSAPPNAVNKDLVYIVKCIDLQDNEEVTAETNFVDFSRTESYEYGLERLLNLNKYIDNPQYDDVYRLRFKVIFETREADAHPRPNTECWVFPRQEFIFEITKEELGVISLEDGSTYYYGGDSNDFIIKYKQYERVPGTLNVTVIPTNENASNYTTTFRVDNLDNTFRVQQNTGFDFEGAEIQVTFESDDTHIFESYKTMYIEELQN